MHDRDPIEQDMEFAIKYLRNNRLEMARLLFSLIHDRFDRGTEILDDPTVQRVADNTQRIIEVIDNLQEAPPAERERLLQHMEENSRFDDLLEQTRDISFPTNQLEDATFDVLIDHIAFLEDEVKRSEETVLDLLEDESQ